MHSRAVFVGDRKSTADERRPRIAAPQTVATSPYRLTRVIQRGRRLDLFRAAATGELGPGCYVMKTPRSNAPTELATAMLCREAAVAAAVQHPRLNCVLAGDYGPPQPYLLLPFHDGVSLRQLLAGGHGSIPVPRALNIVRQVAEALAAMHAAKWLHCQVRPEHVLLSPQGRVTVIDLTSALRLETAECALMDTVAADARYAAPECSCRRHRLTAAADTYSLGILLYEALTGQLPFGGSSSHELQRQHRSVAIPGIRAPRPDVSLEIDHLLRLMLAKEPLRRPSDSELVRCLTELEIAGLAV